MVKRILLAVLAVAVVFCAVVAVQPSHYSVVRSTSIQVSADQVFAQINDFHRWDDWSPWAKIDPAMKTTYSGPPQGEGSVYEWSGNEKVGKGRMTITGSTPPAQVDIRLQIIEPFPQESLTTFRIRPEGTARSHVEWIMSGENGFVSKAFCLVMGGMDKMIGPDFERGLAQMKAAAERQRS